MAPSDASAQGRYQPEGPARRAYESAEAVRQQGDALSRAKDAEGAAAKYREALEGFQEAVQADGAYIDAYARIGQIAYRLKQPKAAIPLLAKGLKRANKHPDLMFWQGQNLLLAGRGPEGVRLLEVVAAQHADAWPEVFLALGSYYFRAKDYRSAEPALEQYVKRNPSAYAVRGRLGNTYFMLRKFAEALAEFEAVRARRPDDVKVLVNIGNAQYQLGQFAKAITVLERALALDPKRHSALFNLAHSYFKLGNHAKAYEHYQRFNAGEPNHFNGLYFAGSALMELGRGAEALELLAQSAALQPKLVNPVYKMGLIHLKARQTDQAEAHFKHALALKKDNPWVISALGTLARQRAQHPEAVRLHARAVSLAPEKARLHGNLALSALGAGDVAGALAAFEKAIALKADDPWIRQLGGSVLAAHAQGRAQAGASAEALAALDRALSFQPAAVTLLASRALLRVDLGQVEGAQADAKAAVAAAPTDARALLAQGRVQLALGQPAAAVAPLTEAIKTQSSAASHGALGAALLLTGDVSGAIEVLDAAVKQWPKVPALKLDRALARFARLAQRLGRSRGAGRDGADLRVALAAVDAMPAGLAAQVRYAAVIIALRQGAGAEARGQLGAMGQALRGAGEAAVLAKAPRDHLAFLRALAAFQTRRYGAAETVLGKMASAKRKGTKPALLARATQERLGAQAYAKGDRRAATQHFKAANTITRQAATTQNLAVLQWLAGRKGPAVKIWRSVKNVVPEAGFNLAVAAEDGGRHREAWQGYAAYGRTGRAHAAKAKEIAEAKRRVFGFEEAP
jgi:tetratricopeptide (TPR) repeat protein